MVITFCALEDPGATTGPSAACGTVTLGLQNTPPSSLTDITFEWQASTTGDVDANYVPTGGVAPTYEAIVGVPTWFRCRITCSSTGAFLVSAPLLVSPDPPNAGSDAALTLCSTAPPVDMFALLGAEAQEGGTWSGPSPVSNGIFNPANMVPGGYVYTVTGIPPCPNATATVTVSIDPCLSIDELGGGATVVWKGQDLDGIHVFQLIGVTVQGWWVYDGSGRMIHSGSRPALGEFIRIPLANARPGIHAVQLDTDRGMIPLRIIHAR